MALEEGNAKIKLNTNYNCSNKLNFFIAQNKLTLQLLKCFTPQYLKTYFSENSKTLKSLPALKQTYLFSFCHKREPFFRRNSLVTLLRTFELSRQDQQPFQHTSFFSIQFLSLLKSLPHLRHVNRLKYFYYDSFDFVDYKRLKKTVFMRLINQRHRANITNNQSLLFNFPRFDSN